MEGWSWRNGSGELENLLGGLEEQGWCLACGVYGHTVAICPFQDEEEEPAQERKAGRRSRKGRGRGKLQQQPQQQQEEIEEDGWEMYVVNLVAELCPGCGAYGHTLAICPTQYEELSIYTSLKAAGDGNPNLILNIEDFDIHSKFERKVNVSLPKKTRNNGTLYTYVFVHQAGVSPWHDNKEVHFVSQLTSYMVPKPQEVNLIGGEDPTQQSESHRKTPNVPDRPVAHWRSRLTLNIMADDFSFDGDSLPGDVHRYMKILQYGKKVQYLPILFVDLLSNRVKDLMVINGSTMELPLTVSYDTISLGKLRFWIHMQDAVYSLQQFGFTEKDADEIKGIFVDTNLYFLALTFVVAAFHILIKTLDVLQLLFDFLAFKNDISFWKKKKSMVGMSSKAGLVLALSDSSRLYPVDKSRVNEYGESYDEKPKGKPHKD
ncbi:UNVERIFIED_CONTAM: hypothetical protein FKN15_003583 [Acipenser sinensis]